jgi:hypothetical protein
MKSTVQDLHRQYNQYNDTIKLYLIHQFDPKIKTWKFTGYQCIHCGSNMKYASSIEKHPQLCKELNKVLTRVKEDPEITLTKDRTLWSPLYEQYSK